MNKILFIYGYGGSPDSTFCTLIREALPSDEYEVLCPDYPQEDCAKAREFMHQYIAENDIDLIIGTSLGAFITLTLDSRRPKIAINPCMVPSVELPKLEPREGHTEDIKPSEKMIATYKPFEPQAYNREALKWHEVIGLFAEEDELLGTKYKESFIDCYDIAQAIPGGHHGNKEAIPAIVEAIKYIFTPKYDVEDWYTFLCELKRKDPFLDEMNFDPEWICLWRKLQKAKSGEVVIRVIEGGNSILKVGDSTCGFTPGFVEGAPVVIGYPAGGSYRGGVIRSIDRENHTFKTAQSTYSYHFVRK